jgi:hypothetical protein
VSNIGPDAVAAAERIGPGPAMRRTRRIVREVDPWSVFKVALVFHAVLYVVSLVTFALLWNVASSTGTIDNFERFMESFGWESFTLEAGEFFRGLWLLGLFWVVLATGLWVLAAYVFNLITDIVGGVSFTVLEAEVVEVTGGERATEVAVPVVQTPIADQLTEPLPARAPAQRRRRPVEGADRDQ